MACADARCFLIRRDADSKPHFFVAFATSYNFTNPLLRGKQIMQSGRIRYVVSANPFFRRVGLSTCRNSFGIPFEMALVSYMGLPK